MFGMTLKKQWQLTGLCGILGTVLLMTYFTAPFWLLPLPPPTANAAEIVTFGTGYHTAILWDTWFQQAGSFLSILFFLALVHLAGVAGSLAGRLVLLVSGIVMALSLAEGTFVLAAVQSGENGHPQAALTAVDLASVFIHIFLLAPSLFLVLGIALRKSSLLPRWFARLAILLGILFQVLGVAGLFSSIALVLVIFVLIAQNIWALAVSCMLLVKAGRLQDSLGQPAVKS
jgi:hypothetical protein